MTNPLAQGGIVSTTFTSRVLTTESVAATKSSIELGRTYSFQNAAQIPEYCAKLAALLDQQSVFHGVGANIQTHESDSIKL